MGVVTDEDALYDTLPGEVALRPAAGGGLVIEPYDGEGVYTLCVTDDESGQDAAVLLDRAALVRVLVLLVSVLTTLDAGGAIGEDERTLDLDADALEEGGELYLAYLPQGEDALASVHVEAIEPEADSAVHLSPAEARQLQLRLTALLLADGMGGFSQ